MLYFYTIGDVIYIGTGQDKKKYNNSRIFYALCTSSWRLTHITSNSYNTTDLLIYVGVQYEKIEIKV